MVTLPRVAVDFGFFRRWYGNQRVTQNRALTAADYEFAMKRLMDPKLSSPNLWLIEGRVLGDQRAGAGRPQQGNTDGPIQAVPSEVRVAR